MYEIWTKHLKTEEEKENFKEGLKRCGWVFDRLKELIDEREQDLDDIETSLAAYDNANWAYRQAHKNGYRSHMKRMKKLLTFDHKEKNEFIRTE